MERTTVFLPADLRRRLGEEARRRHEPQAVVIRRALEQFLAQSSATEPTIIGIASVEGLDARQAKQWVREQWTRKQQG